MFRIVGLSVDYMSDEALPQRWRDSKKIALILLVAAAVLIPTVAILHAMDTSSSNTLTGHDDDHQDQNHQDQNHQDHDDNGTSEDNSMTHADVDDANENTADTD